MNQSLPSRDLPAPASLACRAALLVLALSTGLLSGCAGTLAYRESNALFAEGKSNEGLAKLEQAVQLEPRSIEYRMALVSRRTALLNATVARGDGLLRAGRIAEAEGAYAEALRLDPNHPMALQGIHAIRAEERHGKALADAENLVRQGGEGGLIDAQEKVRAVLSENPDHGAAMELSSRIDARRTQVRKDDGRLAAAYRRPITLEFRDTPVRSVFDVISQITGLKFFFDQEVRPDLRTTIFAKDTSIEDAIRLILVTSQLEHKVLSDDAILIYPNSPQKLKDYQTLLVRSFYITNADVKLVANALKTIAKVRDMVVDERVGLIIIRETPEAIRVAERIVAMQDLGDPEVMLEVEVMEVKRSRLLELGIQWPSQLGLTPLATGSALTLRALGNLNASRIQATIGATTVNARKEDGDASTLANPRIRVRNKEKAKILIGDRVPVISSTSTASGFVSESISYLDVGLKLEVEPVVYLDNEVGIKINLEVSTLIKEILSKSGALSYQIGTRGASTVLRLRNGETQTLAGLISDEDRSSANKVPAIGELPVLGRLFGRKTEDSQRSEILLSITPRIIRAIRRPDLSAAEFDSGTETRMGGASLTLSPLKVETPPAAVKPAAPAVMPSVPAMPSAPPAPALAPMPAPFPAGVPPKP